MKTELSLTRAEVETIVKDHVASMGFEVTGPATFRPVENPGVDFCSMPVKIYHRGNFVKEKEKEFENISLPAKSGKSEDPGGRGGSRKKSQLRAEIEKTVDEWLSGHPPGETFNMTLLRAYVKNSFGYHQSEEQNFSKHISNIMSKLKSKGVIERGNGKWYKL